LGPSESGIRLNLELFYEVVDYVNNGSHSDWARQATLSNIMLSCQALYDFTIPLLYRRIYLRTRRAAHGCFTTLLANSQLASLVREIYIQGKRDPGNEGGYDAIPLLPLFARALLRTPNLQCLMFDSLVYGKYGPYNHQLLSEKPYKFQLQTLGMSSLYLAETDWHDIIPFLTHQSQLQRLHLDFPPPERYAEHLNFPHLKSVAFESSISREEDIAAFFSHLTYVTDVTVRFTDYAPRPHLLFTATRLTRYAPNLTSLTMKLRTMEQFDMFPNEIPLSKTLHFLTILMTDGDMHPYRILLGIESLVSVSFSLLFLSVEW
jgi:hypothetical protein